MRAPLVSVITIFLDQERFLAEAVESVLAQTYPDWELLLVDDGSSDASPELARAYARAHPERIRAMAHPGGANRGMSASRNLGVSASRGELIAFLDADDVYRPEKLSQQVMALATHPEAGMVYGATEHWHSWTGAPADCARDVRRRLGVEADRLVEPPVLARRYLSGAAQTPGTCGVLIRREAIEAVGGFEDRFRGLFEDQAFFYKVALQSPIYVESGSWDRYRQHPASTVRRLQARRLYSGSRPTALRYDFLRWLEAYLAREGVEDVALRELLERELWPYRHPRLYALLAPLRLARLARTQLESRVRALPSPLPSAGRSSGP